MQFFHCLTSCISPRRDFIPHSETQNSLTHFQRSSSDNHTGDIGWCIFLSRLYLSGMMHVPRFKIFPSSPEAVVRSIIGISQCLERHTRRDFTSRSLAILPAQSIFNENKAFARKWSIPALAISRGRGSPVRSLQVSPSGHGHLATCDPFAFIECHCRRCAIYFPWRRLDLNKREH